MNLLLMPMWMLSGAFFPLTGAPVWLVTVMRANPLTYGLAALRRMLYPAGVSLGAGLPSLGVSLAVLVAATILAMILAMVAAERRR